VIYTVTLNPSLDYIVDVPSFQSGAVNRTDGEILNPGGKGINVSLLLTQLGIENTALGISAGFTGREIIRMLDAGGIRTDFIEAHHGISRINVKIRSGSVSEINGQGPMISDEDIAKLYEKLDELQNGDVLVLAGSIPEGMPNSIYMDIMKHLADRQLLTAVDATQNLLLNVLQYKPFLIKPNVHELAEMLGVSINSKEEAAKYAKELQKRGARNVLVSMGSKGAVLVSENGDVFKAASPVGKVLSAVGSGDSMVAGFLAGWLWTGQYEEALRTGLCAGSATAFSDGIADRKLIEEVMASYDFKANMQEG